MNVGWDYLVFLAALGVAAFTPGPGLAAIVATVLAQGAQKTAWFCVGIIFGDLVWLTLSFGGLALIAQQIPTLLAVIKWAGATYLAWLAWKTWNTKPDFGQAKHTKKERTSVARIFAGFAITMGNPKAMLFYVALLPNLVNADAFSPLAALPYYLGVIAVLTTVFSIYVFAAERARQAMRSTRAIRTFNRMTATALGGAAAWIASR